MILVVNRLFLHQGCGVLARLISQRPRLSLRIPIRSVLRRQFHSADGLFEGLGKRMGHQLSVLPEPELQRASLWHSMAAGSPSGGHCTIRPYPFARTPVPLCHD